MKKLSFAIMSISLLLAIVPTILLWEKAEFTASSFYPIAVCIASILYALSAYTFRHKTNLYERPKCSLSILFSDDNEYTYTTEYLKRFYTMLLIECASIPLYLLIILFAKSRASSMLISLAIFASTRLCFIGMGIYATMKEAKEEKSKQLSLKKEKEEQEHREELGHWK